MATEASLALPTMALLSSTEKGCTSPTSRSTCEPPMPAAACDTLNSSSSETRPCARASSASRMVITLVTEATGRGTSAFCSKSTWPLSGSTSMAAAQERAMGGASRSGAALSCGGAAGG